MKFLITGSNGLLGQKLIQKLSRLPSVDLIATSIGQNRLSNTKNYKYISLDITDEDNVNDIISSENPDVVINTAAMTNVDLCEDERERCDALNVDAVRYLANACLKVSAHLIHISTDFIFDGEHGPYKEEDKPNPLSYYGLSKLDSEKILYEHECDWTILR
ncbi:MAG: SDR family oxidoreductase, partial [Bacteroidota bacterium]|nr:SDR family oxidoreductase [Bacteroidota bacterium]